MLLVWKKEEAVEGRRGDDEVYLSNLVVYHSFKYHSCSPSPTADHRSANKRSLPRSLPEGCREIET
jgi:hypothetical protein